MNLAYIASAAQQDAYRTEPPFKLQGSYRNMNKLAAKITPLMRDEELDALLRDHYRGEAQTLTTGAEENLLKLADLLGRPTTEEQARWQAIKDEFVRRRKLGGDDQDGSARIASTLLDVARAVDGLAGKQPAIHVPAPDLGQFAGVLEGMNKSYEQVLLPLVNATYHKLKMDHSLWEEMKKVSAYVGKLMPDEAKPAAKEPTGKKKS